MNHLKEVTISNAADFLSLKTFGIVGVSEDNNKFGNNIFKEMKQKNKSIYQFHPALMFVNDTLCYTSPEFAPEKIEGLIISVKKHKVLNIIKDFQNYDVRNYWIQQGADSEEVSTYAKENNLNIISGKCILMFLEPVKSFHKFHRTIWTWFGKN